MREIHDPPGQGTVSHPVFSADNRIEDDRLNERPNHILRVTMLTRTIVDNTDDDNRKTDSSKDRTSNRRQRLMSTQ